MANKDGEHPESEDMIFSDDDLSNLEDGGSDLFDFSAADSGKISSLDLPDLGDEEPAMELEPDLADSEPEATPLADKKAKGKKAKAKKEKKPKEKKVREKKPKSSRARSFRERKPRSPSDSPSFLVEAKKASPFTVMLVLSATALCIAILLLFIELLGYSFAVSGIWNLS